MVGEDRVTMSGKELRRVHVIRQVMEKQLTKVKAGAVLGLTTRQVRRLLQRIRQAGDRGLVHGGRGKPSNRRRPEQVKAQVLRLYDKQYGDFGPTLAAEKLAERQGLAVSAETLRGWLLAKGVTHFRRRKRPHRAWRARKAHVGELVQLAGSHHDWLEGRGPLCVLMAYIDDASSRVFARFYDHEGTSPAMDSFQRYGTRYGLPLALYADKHTTYQSPAEPTVEEQLAGTKPRSQFGRALRELGVELIAAHSPQATGRVERLFKTFQDRLIKELRLAGITTLEDANRFLAEYLPRYNRRFAVPPAHTADLHRPRPTRPRCWSGACVSRPSGVCGRTSPLRMRGGSIRFTTMSALLRWWSKNTWMGRCGSRTRGGRSGRTSSRRGPCRWQRLRRCPAPGDRSSQRQIIHGASGCCQTEDNTWQQPAHKTGHFYFGRKRTFLSWVDTT